MAHDFANRKKRRPKRKASKQKTGFSLGSFLAGMIVGVGLFLLTAYAPEIFTRDAPLANTAQAATETQGELSTSDAPQESASNYGVEDTGVEDKEGENGAVKDSGVEYIFRDLLTKDAPPPDITAYEAISAPAAGSSTSAAGANASQYLLQSGSFQILADAERRRGELLLMNLPANVVEATVDDKIWYRVVVGPFANRGNANKVVTALRERQIAAIWLERPVPN